MNHILMLYHQITKQPVFVNHSFQVSAQSILILQILEFILLVRVHRLGIVLHMCSQLNVYCTVSRGSSNQFLRNSVSSVVIVFMFCLMSSIGPIIVPLKNISIISESNIFILFQAVLDGRQGPSLQFTENGGVSTLYFSNF